MYSSGGILCPYSGGRIFECSFFIKSSQMAFISMLGLLKSLSVSNMCANFFSVVLHSSIVHELQTSLFLPYMIRHARFQCFSLDYNLSKSLHPYFLTAVCHFLLLAIHAQDGMCTVLVFFRVWAYFRLRYLQISEYCPDAV